MASQQPSKQAQPPLTSPELEFNPVHPLDTELEASQAQVEHRIEQKESGMRNVPPIVASPTASPPHAKGSAKTVTPPRSVAQIQSDMDVTRQRLMSTLDELKVATSPKNIARSRVEKVRDYYVDEYGAVRPERVAKTAAIVVGSIVAIKVTKRVLVAIF